MTRMILRILNKTNAVNQKLSDLIYGHERTWDCLMDHYGHLIQDLETMLTFGAIFEELELFNLKQILTIEELIRIYGKILINSFAITDQNSGSVIGRALYLG